MSDSKHKYAWHVTGVNTWEATARRSVDYVGTITYDDGTAIYTLSIAPDSHTEEHETLGRAKGAFRKYLHNKS